MSGTFVDVSETGLGLREKSQKIAISEIFHNRNVHYRCHGSRAKESFREGERLYESIRAVNEG